MQPPHATNHSHELSPECEAILHDFETAWQGNEPPKIARFLPDVSAFPPRLLFELIAIDLDFRLRNGELTRIEDYLTHHPEIEQDQGAFLDLILLEHALRVCWGADATPGEYALRFPRYAEALRARLGEVPNDKEHWPRPVNSEAAITWPSFPGYQVLRELGRGGMGVVYQGHQAALGRVVALKTLRPECVASNDEINRFRQETEAIAHLDHPHIVPIYEVGDSGGRPYFSMKFYSGGSLAQQVCGPSTDPRYHVRLVEDVARAIHHAHQRGVLHRDLKPSNILLDDSGHPHVTDFGLAKRLDPEVVATRGSGIVGTPAYIAPEQARNSQSVTTASDVYGLGAVLYELLTGEPPFQADNPLATLLQVLESPPQRPSQRNARIPSDLEIICLKCLEKEPSKRYSSALELANDLERWRKGESIRARPVPLGERSWLWIRRHPVVAVLSLVTVLALLLATAALAISHVRISAQVAETSRALAQEQRALSREQRQLYLERVSSASRLWTSNLLPLAVQLLDECPPRFRGYWEWQFLNSIRRPYVNSFLHEDMVTALGYGAGGRYLASAGANGVVQVRDATSGRLLPFSLNHGSLVTGLAFLPDSTQIATASRLGVTLWDAASGREVLRLPGSFWATFSPDGRYVASALGNVVKIWEARTGRELYSLSADMTLVRHGAFSPDGRHLATGGWSGGSKSSPGDGGVVQVWDVARGLPVGESRKYSLPVHNVAYGGRDRGGLLVGQSTAVLLTDATTGQTLKHMDAMILYRTRLPVSPNGRYVAYAVSDRTVRVKDLQTWRDVFIFRGHTGEVSTLAFSPDGRHLASGSKDRTIKVWDLTRDHEFRVLTATSSTIGGLAFNPTQPRLAVALNWPIQPGDHEEAVRVLDTTTGQEVLRLRGCGDVAFGPSGRWLATGTPEGAVTLWDATSGREIRTMRLPEHTCQCLAVGHGGKRLVVGCRDGTIQLWDPASGALIRTWRGHSGRVDGVALSPDESLVATTGPDGHLCFWETRTGRSVRSIGHTSPVSTVAFSPDGRFVAAAGVDQVIRLWEAGTGRTAGTLLGHTDRVYEVAFSPDGQRLVSGSADGTARLWDVESGRELLSLPGAAISVWGVAFSADGLQIAAADLQIKLWDATSALMKSRENNGASDGLRARGTPTIATPELGSSGPQSAPGRTSHQPNLPIRRSARRSASPDQRSVWGVH